MILEIHGLDRLKRGHVLPLQVSTSPPSRPNREWLAMLANRVEEVVTAIKYNTGVGSGAEIIQGFNSTSLRESHQICKVASQPHYCKRGPTLSGNLQVLGCAEKEDLSNLAFDQRTFTLF